MGTDRNSGADIKLQTGDPCPCCGRPIKSRDPDVLRLLTMIAVERRFPTKEEIRAIVERGRADG